MHPNMQESPDMDQSAWGDQDYYSESSLISLCLFSKGSQRVRVHRRGLCIRRAHHHGWRWNLQIAWRKRTIGKNLWPISLLMTILAWLLTNDRQQTVETPEAPAIQ